PAMDGGFIWDDDAYVTENEALRSGAGLKDIWLRLDATPQYYPLVFTTFWVEYRLWELEPYGYHVVNVLLHGLGAALLWLILRRLAVPGAWIAAAVFALHPVHVESVAWITERKNVLSGMLYLAALLAYIRFARPELPKTPRACAWRWYVAALLLFIGALLSKTVVCSLPAVILLLLWWKRQRLSLRDIWPLLPFFAVGAALALVTVWVEGHHVGAKIAGTDLSIAERCLVAGRVPWFYLGKLVWPTELTFIYPRWTVEAARWWLLFFPAAVLVGLVTLWHLRRAIGWGPLVAALFFIGTLFPALGFIDVFPMRYSFVADHFQYLASIGPIALLTALAVTAFKRVSQRTPDGTGDLGRSRIVPRAAGVAFVGVVLGTFGILTWQQGGIYRNTETLWRDTVAKNPRAWMARINLGNILVDQGKLDEAAAHFRAVLPADVKDAGSEVLARAHFNLGNTMARQGMVDEAQAEYEEAIKIEPRYHPAYHGLGWAYEMRSDYDAAIEAYRTAVRLKPEYTAAQQALEAILAKKARIEAAAAELSLDP
ncbi:MAG: tetratricopeptide repeat protein, partial [Planctomycetota bacterium]